MSQASPVIFATHGSTDQFALGHTEGGRRSNAFALAIGESVSSNSQCRGARPVRSRTYLFNGLFALLLFAVIYPVKAQPTTFVVNSLQDRHDQLPGDGVRDDGLGQCTLRAALEELNAAPKEARPWMTVAGRKRAHYKDTWPRESVRNRSPVSS